MPQAPWAAQPNAAQDGSLHPHGATATTPHDATAFPIETAYGPAVVTFFDRDRALIAGDRLTVGRIAYEVRYHLRRDHTGRFAYQGLYIYRVADRWTPPTQHATHALAGELRRVVNAFADANPEGLAAAAVADALRTAAGLDADAAWLDEQAAAKRAEAAALRDLRYVEARMFHPDDALYRTHHRIRGGRRDAAPRREADDRAYGAAFDHQVQTGILGSDSVRLLEEATSSTRPEVLTAFQLLIGSSIHDINALRGIMGQPDRVVSAHLWAGGTSFTTVLSYPGGPHATYTWTLLPYLKHYQQELSFFASEGRVHIRFPSPYLRNEPTLVDVEEMDGDELRVSRLITSYEEAFKLELVHFSDCVTHGRPPLTDAAGFRADLELLTEIARSF